MDTFYAPLPSSSPLSTRLSRLAPLEAGDVEALREAERNQRRLPAQRELVRESEMIRERRALVSGWACRQRILSDGRRQILSFLLPGDLVGVCQHSNPIASTTIVTVMNVLTCPVPAAGPGSGLLEAYYRSGALEEYYLSAHITRLGRLDAFERLLDWFLELRERLAFVDLSTADQFPLPLTQEMLADTLGLTSVHVNRTLQAIRREGLLTLRSGMISLLDRARMEKLVDYKPARVSSDN